MPTKAELAVLKARAALNNVIVVDAATPATTPVQEDTTPTMQETLAATTDTSFVGSLDFGIPTSDSGISTEAVIPFVTGDLAEDAALLELAQEEAAVVSGASGETTQATPPAQADATAESAAAFIAQNTPAPPAPPTALASLEIAMRVIDQINRGVDLTDDPEMVRMAGGEIRKLISAAGEAVSGAAPAVVASSNRAVARLAQPPSILGSDGKLLRKMWLHTATAADAVFGPFVVGDTTKVGWVVRDTRTGADEEFGRGNSYKLAAQKMAETLADDIDPALYDELEAVALGRIVPDGTSFTAR